jgi:peptidoglycan/LPS O-acetylase OafA/YrhL
VEASPLKERHQPAFARRLDGIEGLRGVAAVAVVVYHVWTNNNSFGGSDLGAAGNYLFSTLSQGVSASDSPSVAQHGGLSVLC